MKWCISSLAPEDNRSAAAIDHKNYLIKFTSPRNHGYFSAQHPTIRSLSLASPGSGGTFRSPAHRSPAAN